MTKYLLIGGSGFIGTNLASKLAANPSNEVSILSRSSHIAPAFQSLENVRWLKGSLDNSCDFDSLVQGTGVVMHLVSSSVPATLMPNEVGLFHDAQPMTKLLEACVSRGISKFIYFSSSTVYGNGASPFRETDQTWPVSAYGVQKVAMEKIVGLFRNAYGLNCTIVRPSNPYGPHQKPGIQGVIGTFVNRALRGESLEIVGDGCIERDFIFIDDLVEGVMRTIDYQGDEFVFNLGSGHGTTIIDIATLVEEAIPSSGSVALKPGRDSDAKSNVLDMHRFDSTFGTIDYTPLEEGIAKVIEYQRTSLT